VLFAVVLCFGPIGLAGPIGTAFTYQGRLIDSNNAADGLYDFQFKLYDANGGGNKLGQDVNMPEIDVIDGYFTAELDFGSVLDGNNRWLDIGVRPGVQNDPCAYSLLSPRQKVTPTPYTLQTRGIFVDNTGNVGIGTTTPDGKLTVEGDYITIKATNSSPPGAAVYGVANYNSSPSTNYGGYFRADGSYGRGVYGVASNSGYDNYGGYFEASGVNGTGVFALAYGNNGRGVYALSYGYYGVYGSSLMNGGFGVYGIVDTNEGSGVSGVATNSGNNSNNGGYFASGGREGKGVYGYVSHASGTNFGVYGRTNSPNGYAGYFFGGKNYFQGNVGIGTTSPARALHVSDVMRLQPRATAPASPAEGDIYMDSTTHKLMVYDGTAWKACW
jgi:hypothetical protein